MRLISGITLLAALAAAASAAPEDLPGRIWPNIACSADPAQTYALYVPATYTRAQRWPVIFCFDPGARGRVPVERLHDAAERFGVIVVGSNTSRNGPWADNLTAMQAMVRDVEAHLAIDTGRVYAAGLSGGARVAAQMGLLGMAKGVIGCSAGFPAMTGGIPRDVRFAFFGTAGSEDFNHRELQQLDEDLAERRAVHRIVFFAGGHEWAPPALLAEAVEWLELQAMHTGARPRDAVLIAQMLQRRMAAVEALPPGPAWRELEAIAAEFAGLTDVTAIAARAKAQAATREVKAWRKEERARAREEADLAAALAERASDASVESNRRFAAELRRRADVAEDTADRQMVRRVMAEFVSLARETLRTRLEQREYDDAITMLELVVALQPGPARTHYDLARVYGLAGDRRRSLAELAAAAAAGFADAERVEAEKAFARWRQDRDYVRALAAIRANPAEPGRPSRERP